MKPLLLSALCFVTLGMHADGRKSFNLDSTGSTYPFVTHLAGAFAEHGDSLVVDVSGGLVESQIPGDLGTAGTVDDVSITFGLGRPNGDGWSFDNEAPAQQVAPHLGPGMSHPVAPTTFIVRGLDTVPVSDRWLVAQVFVQEHLPGIKAGVLASYACAEENLHGATPASRARRDAMRRGYAQSC